MKTLTIYDFDETIMCMPTSIKLKQFIKGKWIERSVDSAEFALIRNNKNVKVDDDKSFTEFYEDHHFIKHITDALDDKRFGPAFNDFKRTIINADDFVIVTSRGHSFNAILTGIMLIIVKCFTTDELCEMNRNMQDIGDYLSSQKIFTIFSDEFELMHCKNKSEYICGADRKKLALNNLLIVNKHIKDYDKIIFFDDDKANLMAIKDLFIIIGKKHKDVKLEIYDTSKKLIRLFYSTLLAEALNAHRKIQLL
jgi:hypothetical protein